MRLFAASLDVFEEKKIQNLSDTNFVALHDVPTGNVQFVNIDPLKIQMKEALIKQYKM